MSGCQILTQEAFFLIDISQIGAGLVLKPDDAVDLHLHTYASDGAWSPPELIDYLAGHHFRVAAVCDHDTQRSVAESIELGAARGVLIIPGIEATCSWRERQLHMLVYGIHPDSKDPDAADFFACTRDLDNQLITNAEDARQRIEASGRPIPNVHELHGDRPMWPFHVLTASIKAGHNKGLKDAAELVIELGGKFTADIPVERLVAAVHKAGGICVVAHPGRADAVGVVTEEDLDTLIVEAPIDGVEAHYRSYTDAQTAQYRAAAEARGLLVSCGSDSHAPNQPVNPRAWKAIWCADLLARFGIQLVEQPELPWAEGMDPEAAQPEPAQAELDQAEPVAAAAAS